MSCFTDQAAFHAGEFGGDAEPTHCDCCGEALEYGQYEIVTFYTKQGDVDEYICPGCCEHELGG